MKKTYHISPSTTIIRKRNSEIFEEFQPSGWPIWPSDDPAADAIAQVRENQTIIHEEVR